MEGMERGWGVETVLLEGRGVFVTDAKRPIEWY